MTAQRIEVWRAGLGADRERPLTNRTRNKSLTILGGIMERATRVYGLPSNPVRDVDKLRERYDTTRFDFYSPEEVWALVRAAASEQDGAIFLTAAYTGLRRGELVALRWRDVDFDRSAVRVAGSYPGRRRRVGVALLADSGDRSRRSPPSAQDGPLVAHSESLGGPGCGSFEVTGD